MPARSFSFASVFRFRTPKPSRFPRDSYQGSGSGRAGGALSRRGSSVRPGAVAEFERVHAASTNRDQRMVTNESGDFERRAALARRQRPPPWRQRPHCISQWLRSRDNSGGRRPDYFVQHVLHEVPVGIAATGTRWESSSLGCISVRADRYWGAATQSALKVGMPRTDRLPD